MGPFDYTFQQPTDPFGSAVKGFEYGTLLNERDRQRAAEEAQAQAAQQRQAQISEIQKRYYSTKQPTAQDFMQYASTLDSKMIEPMLKVFQESGAEGQRQQLQQLGQIGSALSAGDGKTAAELIRQRGEAYRNSGNDAYADAAEVQAQIAEKDPSISMKSIVPLIASLPGGAEVVSSIFGSRKTEAETVKAEAETKKVSAETKLKEIEAKFAPQKIQSEIGLTRAQTGQATASAAASYASADSSRASAEKTRKETLQMIPGAVPAEDRPKIEMNLRKEYADQTKTYKDTKEAYSRVLAAKPGAIGDISLIYGYMKMLDPGSVVREGEYATAENARGVSDTIRNLYNKVSAGERLTDAQRKNMRGQAGKVYEAALNGEKTVRSGVERIAKNYGLNVENVFFEPTETPPGVSPSSAGDEPPPGAVRLKGAR